MNAVRVLQRGQKSFLDILKDLPEQNWSNGFVTGSWTVKDVIDHLAGYEALQVEAFSKFLDPSIKTPLLDQKTKGSFAEFNQEHWEENKNKSWQEILDNYMRSYSKLEEIVKIIPFEIMAKPNTTTWYGEPSQLDDIIALNFGHKKHHLAQIKLFRQKNSL